MNDEQLGAIVLGAAVGGLLSLWLFGVGGGIVGAIVGAMALATLVRRRT